MMKVKFLNSRFKDKESLLKQLEEFKQDMANM